MNVEYSDDKTYYIVCMGNIPKVLRSAYSQIHHERERPNSLFLLERNTVQIICTVVAVLEEYCAHSSDCNDCIYGKCGVTVVTVPTVHEKCGMDNCDYTDSL